MKPGSPPRNRCILTAVITCFALSVTVHARSINDGIGRTSFSWLKAIPDAAISAAGECYAARDGVQGLFVHPAAINDVEKSTLKMSYVSHYVDTQYGSIGYARKYRDQNVGIRFTYVNYGSFEGRSINNESTGTFSAGDMGISVNMGKKLRDDLKVGATVSYLTSKLEDYSAQAAAVDLGMIYKPPFDGLTIGASLMNVGTVMKSYTSGFDETMPVYLAAGFRKSLAHAPLTIYSDVIFPNDYDITYAYGLEINVRETLFLYAGTRTRSDIDTELEKSSTDFSALPSFGFGLTVKSYRFNYAYCPDDEIENIHKITIGASY